MPSERCSDVGAGHGAGRAVGIALRAVSIGAAAVLRVPQSVPLVGHRDPFLTTEHKRRKMLLHNAIQDEEVTGTSPAQW